MDHLELAIQLSKKRLRLSSLEVYRSMWSGYCTRLASNTAAGSCVEPGSESVAQLVAAVEGAGDYSIQKRVHGLVRWIYSTLGRHGWTVTSAANDAERLYLAEFRPHHEPLTPTWQAQMVKAATEVSTGWKGTRLAAIVTLLCETALKNKELLELRLSSVLGDPPTALMAGKGDTQREFKLSPQARDALAAWLVVRPAGHTDYLFVSDDSGRPMDSSTLWRHLKKVTTAVQGAQAVLHFGTGLIRATKARELLDSGASTTQISKFLGHRQESSTGELLVRVQAKGQGGT